MSRRFEGLGLGLSIVRYLVDLHGGSVHAWSEGEGKGATFTVLLPAGAARMATEKSGGPSEAAEESHARQLLEGVRVLIVEDDADTLDFLARYIASQGAEVLTAAGAAAALAMLPDSGADILVSDIGLPEMDGYELMQRVRQMDGRWKAGIPAIALTAYARPEDRARAFHADYQAHLAKPVEPPELADAIARFASPSRTAGSE